MENSVSRWIARLKSGDEEAAERLWRRFADRLLGLAAAQVPAAPGVGDQEDVAQSVFFSLCRGAAQGRFQGLANRDELWWLLIAITRQKVVDRIRRETAVKRGKGQVIRECDLSPAVSDGRHPSLDELVGVEPTPDFMCELEEQHCRLLSLLRDDQLRRIAVARIEGYADSEIAAAQGVSLRTVERKLELIRRTWAKEFFGDK